MICTDSAAPPSAASSRSLRPRRLAGPKPGDRDPEDRSSPQLARHADLPAHEIDEAFADRQAEARAAARARGRSVGLGEPLEDDVQAAGRYAGAGVRHLEPDPVETYGRNRERDPTLIGEYYGVAQEVHPHLTQPDAKGVLDLDHGAGRIADLGGITLQPDPGPVRGSSTLLTADSAAVAVLVRQVGVPLIGRYHIVGMNDIRRRLSSARRRFRPSPL